MQKTTYRYLYGSLAEVSTGAAPRLCSSIESPAVREALLAPRNNPAGVIVFGALQQREYLFISPDCKPELERIKKDLDTHATQALGECLGKGDPYPSELISIIYNPQRILLGELQQQLPPDPLQRVRVFDWNTFPRFAAKALISDKEFGAYGPLMHGIYQQEHYESAVRNKSILERGLEKYGLTRIEALQLLALQQSLTRQQSETFGNARHSLIHLFATLKMLDEVEEHVAHQQSGRYAAQNPTLLEHET